MKTDLALIKEELQRRFSETSTKSRWEFLVRTQNYFNFISTVPALKSIIENEEKNFSKKIKDKTYRHAQFLFSPIYRDMPKMISALLEAESPGAQVLIKRTRVQKIIKWFGLEDGSDNKQLPRFFPFVKIFHNQLLDRMAEQEFGSQENVPVSEAIKKLNISSATKWEDLELSFRNGFEVIVKCKGAEFVANHEQMGFVDQRKGLAPKKAWDFLQLLSANEGVYNFRGETEDRIKKVRKRKQELVAALQEFFQIKDDPFESIRKGDRTYKLRFALRPEPDMREDYRDKDLFDE